MNDCKVCGYDYCICDLPPVGGWTNSAIMAELKVLRSQMHEILSFLRLNIPSVPIETELSRPPGLYRCPGCGGSMVTVPSTATAGAGPSFKPVCANPKTMGCSS